jgi:hypothetical protein
MHQRPSRCCMWPIVSAATSDRRKAQPSSTAIMARSRSPLVVVISGALRSACACFSDSQLPARTPMDLLAPADRWSSGGPAEERQGIPLSQTPGACRCQRHRREFSASLHDCRRQTS